MSKILITEPYDSYDPAIKEAYFIASEIAKSGDGVIDIVIPTLDSNLINFLGIKTAQILRSKRACIFNGIKLNLLSCETARRIYESSCLLVLCVPDNFTNSLLNIDFKKCIVVPRHNRNTGTWKNFQQSFNV